MVSLCTGPCRLCSQAFVIRLKEAQPLPSCSSPLSTQGHTQDVLPQDTVDPKVSCCLSLLTPV